MTKTDSGFIKRLKEVVGENVSAFARETGIPQPSLHGYLSGRYTPGYEFFVTLAQRGVDLNWLVQGSEERASKEELQRNREVQKLTALMLSIPLEDIQIVLRTTQVLARELTQRRKVR